MTLPTSVNETLEDGKIIITTNGRRIGCKLAVHTLIEAQQLLVDWWEQENNKQWVWGDFILECERRWGDEQTTQIIPDNDYAAQTIANWSSVAKQYTHTERIYDVRWSIYAEVAYVWDRTLRTKLLLWAEKTQATVQEVRAEKKKVTEAAQDAPILNETPTQVQTAIELDNAQLQQILTGNIRGLFSIIKQWRQVIQPGRRYRVVLQEIE